MRRHYQRFLARAGISLCLSWSDYRKNNQLRFPATYQFGGTMFKVEANLEGDRQQATDAAGRAQRGRSRGGR